MGEFKPNGEQARAIAVRDRDVFVSAAAGSGKTRVMTERFVAAVIEDSIPVDRILTITFTKEAAAQLQDRIKTRLLEAGLVDEGRRIPDAHIGTIHGFCSRVLRAHAFAAGIDPNFTILEDTAAKMVVNDSINLTLNEFADRSEANLDFICQIGKDTLAKTVVSLHAALRSAGFSNPADGLGGAKLMLTGPEGLSAQSSGAGALPHISPSRATIDDLIGSLKGKLDFILNTADRSSSLRTYLANFALAEDLIAYLSIHGNNILPGLSERFRFSTQANVSKTVFGPVKELLKELDDAIATSLVLRYHDFYFELLQIFSKTYGDQKAAVSGLDFEDLQLLAKDLLEYNPRIRESYKQKFKLVMVDEFQDTNRLQCDLINLIANGSLFTVGDENQSIYRFRHADVSVFRSLRGRIQEKPGDGCIKLPRNYRSREEVIAFVNRVGSSFNLFDEHNLPLEAGRKVDTFKAGVGPAIELCFVDGSQDGADPVQVEADFIVQRIEEVLAEGVYEPNDIAILIPKRTKLKEIEGALKTRGVDYYTIGGTGYYGTDEVAELRDLLSVLANPYDDLALIGVLRGPCVRLSDDALFELRLAARKVEGEVAPLWHAVVHDKAELQPCDRDKLEAFLITLNVLREYAAYSSLSSVVDRAMSETGYDLCTLMRDHKGTLRYANIRKLMRIADAYEQTHGPNLAGFVDYLAVQKDLSSQEGEAALADEDIGAVRIMTIHASKGLQFPVVFLALSKSKPTYASPGSSEMVLFCAGTDSLSGAQYDSKPSVAFKVAGAIKPYETSGYTKLKEELKSDTNNEDKRLLHVALTRAEERLFITGICNVDKDSSRAEGATYIEWLMPAVGLDQNILKSKKDAACYDWRDEGVDFRMVCVGDGYESANVPVINADRTSVIASSSPGAEVDLPDINLEPVRTVGMPPVCELSYTSIGNYLECAYRFYLQHVVGLTALQISGLEDVVPFEQAEQQGKTLASQQYPLSPAEFGSIVHKILEALDIVSLVKRDKGALADITDEVAANYGALNESDWERILHIIKDFGESEIAARLSNAERIRKETPFIFKLGDTNIVGRMDVVAYEQEGVLVVDYKTGKTGPDLEDLEKHKYGLQLDIYALAILKTGVKRVEVALVGLENGSNTVAKTYTQKDAGIIEGELLQVLESINRSDNTWPLAADSMTCAFCNMGRFCRRSAVLEPAL